MSQGDGAPVRIGKRGLRLRGGWTAVALALAILLLVALHLWNEAAPSRAIARMDPAARRAEFTRLSEELRSVCSPPDAALADHCRHQALFLARFPECDAECERLVRRALPVEPTR